MMLKDATLDHACRDSHSSEQNLAIFTQSFKMYKKYYFYSRRDFSWLDLYKREREKARFFLIKKSLLQATVPIIVFWKPPFFCILRGKNFAFHQSASTIRYDRQRVDSTCLLQLHSVEENSTFHTCLQKKSNTDACTMVHKIK